MTVINAFLFIGLDLTGRDKLHEFWKGNRLFIKMACLIAAGSLISWFLNSGAGQIALASFISFAVSAVVDTVIYHLLSGRTRWIRVNGSNLFSALTDSVLFPTLAFGSFSLVISAGQFLAKIAGGWAWFLVLNRKK